MFLKKSAEKSVVRNVVTLNTYAENNNFIFKDNSVTPLKKLSFNTDNFIISYVANKHTITTSVSISRSIQEEDIHDILDIKAYEELGLDEANSYVIASVEVESDKDERLYHIFVSESETLNKLFIPIKTQTKYIDLITPAPLLYKSLYTKQLLSNNNNAHGFIYFSLTDAFISIYKNGEYLYSKSIEFSLEQLYDKYCELVGEKIDEALFFTVLESEGLKSTNPDYQKHFTKIFADMFITINDIIIYVKRAFELKTINELYIGSSKGSILGLDEYSQNYLGLSSSEFNFDYGLAPTELYIDPLHYLMFLSSSVYMEDDSGFVNLSTYPRAPSFVNRASGQFIIATFSAISMSLAYPLVYLVGSYVNDAKVYALTIENDTLSQEASKYKGILADKKSQIVVLDKEIEELVKRYDGKTKTLTSIYNKKVNYRLKSGIFHTIAEELTKFEVNIDMLRSDNDTLWLSLVSSDDRKFTEVIKHISDTHFDEIISIDIDKIEKDPINNYYKGLLKVELK